MSEEQCKYIDQGNGIQYYDAKELLDDVARIGRTSQARAKNGPSRSGRCLRRPGGALPSRRVCRYKRLYSIPRFVERSTTSQANRLTRDDATRIARYRGHTVPRRHAMDLLRMCANASGRPVVGPALSGSLWNTSVELMSDCPGVRRRRAWSNAWQSDWRSSRASDLAFCAASLPSCADDLDGHATGR